MNPDRRRALALCVGYVGLHFLTQYAARLFESAPGLSYWYPPAGLAFALLYRLGPGYSPIVFATNVVAACFTTGLGSWWSPLLFPGLITAVYTLAAALARGSRPGRGSAPWFKPPQVVRLGSALVLAPAGIAALGTAVLLLLGFVAWERADRSFVQWWVGDFVGMMTVVPLALWTTEPRLGQR